jgi:hypothetical protein
MNILDRITKSLVKITLSLCQFSVANLIWNPVWKNQDLGLDINVSLGATAKGGQAAGASFTV